MHSIIVVIAFANRLSLSLIAHIYFTLTTIIGFIQGINFNFEHHSIKIEFI